MRSAVTFYSEGMKLQGDLYRPDGATPGPGRPGVVLCHGYTGVKDLYLPDNAAALVAAGARRLDGTGTGVHFEKDGEIETFHRSHPAEKAKRYQR